MNKIKFINQFTKGNNYKLLVVFLATLIYVGVVLFNPLVLQYTLDNVIGLENVSNPWSNFLSSILGGVEYVRNHLYLLSIIIIVLSGISGIAIFFRGEASGSYCENFAQNIRNSVYDHLQSLPYSYHVKAKTGDLIQRCTSDIDTITRFLGNQIKELIYAIIMVTIALTILFSINVPATFVTMIVFPFIFIFGYVFFKKMEKTFRKSDEAEAELSHVFQESLDAVRVVKAFNNEKFELEKFDEKNKEYRNITTKMITLLAYYWGISDALCFTQILIVLLYSIFSVRNGVMTIGDAVIFISYVSMVLWPIRNVGRILSDLGKVSVAVDRLEEILVVTPEDFEKGSKPDIKGGIEFKDVTFMYDDGDTNVLENVSFDIKPGETVAIMGSTGSGKSSLVHLLTRLYEPSSGEIIVDGNNIKDMSLRHIRSNVGIVLQEPYLFSKSILDNIRVASPKSTREEVYNAARMASVHDVISEFDVGYDTMVGEKGVTLSGGQKQRVAIARTIINEQPIVIFDDSLSALDTHTDATIRKALRERENKVTTLIITHRINTTQGADKIIVMQHGKIVQMGTHETLIKQEGVYRKIAKIQGQVEGEDDNEL